MFFCYPQIFVASLILSLLLIRDVETKKRKMPFGHLPLAYCSFWSAVRMSESVVLFFLNLVRVQLPKVASLVLL